MPDIRSMTCPPESIANDLLPVINARIRSFLTSSSPKELADDILQYITVGLNIHAGRSLQNLGTLPPTRADLLPLQGLVKLIDLAPDALEEALPVLVLDATLAYPTHISTIRPLISSLLSTNPSFGIALKQEIIEASIRMLERENSRILKCEKDQPPGPVHIPKLAYSLLIYSRAHGDMSAAITGARNSFAILKLSYEIITSLPSTSLDATRKVQTKSHLLLLLHTLLEPLPPSDREWKLEMMDDDQLPLPAQSQASESGSGSTTLVNTGITHDYHAIFSHREKHGTGSILENEMDVLRSLGSGMKLHTHEEDESVMVKVSSDHQIAPILNLFPSMPPDLLYEALRHPRFAPYKAHDGGPDDAVTILTNAMLDDSLPGELKELGRRVRAWQGQNGAGDGSGIGSGSGSGNGVTPAERSRQPSPEKTGTGTATGTGKKTFKRDNIFNDVPMDFSKLSFGRKNDDDLGSYTAAVPDHIRQSIMRLTEQQRSEEDAEREAEREEARLRRQRSGVGAAGPSTSSSSRAKDKERDRQIRTVAFEEELEGDDLLDDETDALEARVRLNLREGEEGSSDGESYVNSEEDDEIGAGGTEDVYLEQLYISNKSAFDRTATTRRSKVREQMRQQTGWSDEQLEGWKIMLERNPLKDKILSRHGDPRGNRAPVDRGGGQPNRGSGGGGRGGGGSNDRGRGGGGGRGRGGANKSSRGHQNAARTRGHDRKMARMGAA